MNLDLTPLSLSYLHSELAAGDPGLRAQFRAKVPRDNHSDPKIGRKCDWLEEINSENESQGMRFLRSEIRFIERTAILSSISYS
jgi:hypothetical protein